MNLEELLSQGRVRRRKPSKGEIRGLLQVADLDLKDATVPGLSWDRLFPITYEAALALATIPLRCAGYDSHGLGKAAFYPLAASPFCRPGGKRRSWRGR